ncbi:spore germination protein [Metabacillus malikii]|uniref:Spore germination protein KA n=1 Tax=Metabacillus malikii TaxID=1504265 RepID=A0ABT9ZDM1_9BACI|nr:spore germination protein [Metabacillus malikii]MDQ0230356.1 spore germination protein KA [Metabacillus malikii]
MSIFSYLFKRRKNKHRGKTTDEELFLNEDIPNHYSSLLDKNLKSLENVFHQTSDLQKMKIHIGGQNGCICYLNTTLNKNDLNAQILEPLKDAFKDVETNLDIEKIRKAYFPAVAYEYADSLHQIVWQMLNGSAVIMINNSKKALALNIGGTEKRSIVEPSTQTIIRGPKDSFIEDIDVNIGLVRKRIKNPRLVFEEYIVGKDSHTRLSIGYMKGVVNEDILSEARQRIKKIKTSAVLDTGNIEEMITDTSFTCFPLIFNTERPDSISGHILEGKIAVFLDGTPFALSMPSVFTDFFQSTEDYYQPFFLTSFIRILRFMAFMITLILPSLYVGIITYHQELIPNALLINIQAQRESVPFPAVVELLLMEFTFEVLREAGTRMPRAVGQTLSIVGALVIGQAAVEAGLVSNVLVIVVAFSAIASFVSPIFNFSVAARLIRFLLIIAAAIMGFYGILLSLILMVIHLVSLRTFGVPYLTPVAPFKLIDQKDIFVRFPIWTNTTRPSYLKSKAPLKVKNHSKPVTPDKKEENNQNE